ncbi:MAG: Clan AA aspartic protease, AF_0612 family [Parcubacteria group bacterium GW2011_GWA2_47_12]|uniref:Clan AA aspartic protease n=1 Tax=Candidatus Giovannonibacteria bacterium RIFCSPLOWO2_01_FULL_44_16 TaxID=1798348 RepID=A0A1F5X1J0_9BACT|nr:MAG: Clan AA aspartic protease, AF_0612 family [Parcubacteria group bacterium GW2011_GWA2_47_12]OGF81766.1 MAG: hypothetical protein A2924_00980 [Candidatus Giovannonibacteria bacterium RIFCSPLOWO2_01_FULL_44_16]
MISGKFIGNIPLIRVAVASGYAVRTPLVVLDSGFTGDLQVSSKVAEELRLQPIGATSARIADGKIIQVPVALASAAMEGEMRSIEVLISEGMPLIGIGFLSKFGYKASLDCKNKTVSMEIVWQK